MSSELITTQPIKTKPGETVKVVTDQLPESLTAQGNLKVAVVEGGAGGGLSQIQVRNSGNVWTDVGYSTGNLNVPVQIQADTSGILKKADLNVDAEGDLQVDVKNLPNPANLDVALSTRASEATLTAIKNALASVGTDKMRTSLVDALPAGSNTIGNIGNLLNPHPVKLAPEHKLPNANQYSGTYAPTAAGSLTIIAAASGYYIRVYDFVLWNSGTADVGVRLYFGTSGKNLFKGKLAPKTGVVKSLIHPWESNAGDSLVLYLDAAGTCDYCIGAVQSTAAG
ncbi:MAG: hypothetical protein QXH03_09525 [Candidatus Bathyarchaeia archaeon]